MKSTTNIEETIEIEKKIDSKECTKFSENDDMILLIKKKLNKTAKDKNTAFRNNYKNYQYDYEEDFYEPRY